MCLRLFFVLSVILMHKNVCCFNNCKKLATQIDVVPNSIVSEGYFKPEEETRCEINFPLDNLPESSCKYNRFFNYCVLHITSIGDSTIIPENSFTNIPIYNKIVMENVGIEEISPGAFGDNIKNLDLSANEIEDLNNIFDSATNLETINLSSNEIKSIPNQLFVNNLKITDVDFSNNDISDFSLGIFNTNVYNVDRIDLSFNAIKTFTEFRSNIRVKKLDLTDNFLSHISICVYNYENINLSNNILKVVPDINCDVKSSKNNALKSLDLSHNKLLLIDQSFFNNFHHLETLLLNNNEIEILPNKIFVNLINLKILNLSRCRLKKLEYGLFDDLKKLFMLDLSYNKLKTIDFAIIALNKLLFLYVNNNNIEVINTKYLTTFCPELMKISLHNNDFNCIDLMKNIYELHLKSVEIVHRGVKNSSNLLEISCKDTDKYNNEDMNSIRNFGCFNGKFENSELYLYLEDLKIMIESKNSKLKKLGRHH